MTPETTPWAVIDALDAPGRARRPSSADQLRDAAALRDGALILGEPGQPPHPVDTAAALTVITIEGVQLPAEGTAPADHSLRERIAQPVLALAILYASRFIYSGPADRRRQLHLDEVHFLARWSSGRSFFQRLARDSRKRNTAVFASSQVPARRAVARRRRPVRPCLRRAGSRTRRPPRRRCAWCERPRCTRPRSPGCPGAAGRVPVSRSIGPGATGPHRRRMVAAPDRSAAHRPRPASGAEGRMRWRGLAVVALAVAGGARRAPDRCGPGRRHRPAQPVRPLGARTEAAGHRHARLVRHHPRRIRRSRPDRPPLPRTCSPPTAPPDCGGRAGTSDARDRPRGS